LSQRAIRRAQQRRLASERRRETLRRRRAGLAVTAAIGAAAFFAPAANAAPFEVNSLNDAAANGCDSTTADGCTLRDAITDANASSGDDTITFASGLSGTITLTEGQIPINASNGGLTVQGPGADQLTVSGNDKSRIFSVSGANPVGISGLTFTHGYVYQDDGGAIYTTNDSQVTVADSVFTSNQAYSDTSSYSSDSTAHGGAIGAHGPITVTGSRFEDNNRASQAGGGIYVEKGLTLRSSQLSGNTTDGRGGGIAAAKYRCQSQCSNPSNVNWFHSDLDIADSTISGNSASNQGGGIAAASLLTLAGSTVSGNSTTNAGSGIGGGIASVGKYAQTQISDSTISGNSSTTGGGIAVAQFYKYLGVGEVKHAVKSEISNTTISGNNASRSGAGLDFSYLGDGDHFTITHSTISGNDAASAGGTGLGGGIHFASKYSSGPFKGGPIDGEFRTVDTTISGNTAGVGGGVSVGNPQQTAGAPALTTAPPSPRHAVVDLGSIDFENSTIASNSATSNGGGVYLNQYHETTDDSSPLTSPTISLTSSILADNSAAGSANDADRADGSGGGALDTSFSLVENPGDAPITQSPSGSTITGVDPALGPLANNGGPTLTHLPSNTSPVIDKGKAPARLLTDQRGLARTVAGDVPDAAGGDGTDIGAVEVQNPARNVVGPTITPPSPGGGGDGTPPQITLTVPKELTIQQLIDGFDVTVKCNEPCSMTFRLFGSAPTGTLHSAGYNFRLLNRKIGRTAGKRKIHLRPCIAGAKSRGRTHVCRKRITQALYAKPQKSFKVKLIVAAKDKAGNLSHKKRFIRIHR
jgi:hypothetical protein